MRRRKRLLILRGAKKMPFCWRVLLVALAGPESDVVLRLSKAPCRSYLYE